MEDSVQSYLFRMQNEFSCRKYFAVWDAGNDLFFCVTMLIDVQMLLIQMV